MINIIWIFIAMAVAVILCLASVLLGAFLMFRGQRTTGGGFFKEPKGAVFSIPDADLEQAGLTPGAAEERIMENTEKFLKTLGGVKNG